MGGAEIFNEIGPRLFVFCLAILKPIGMVEMKIHCVFVKGGTRFVVLISCNKHRCTLANAGKKLFAQFPKARSIHTGFPIDK
jgi:hypothetical protein